MDEVKDGKLRLLKRIEELQRQLRSEGYSDIYVLGGELTDSSPEFHSVGVKYALERGVERENMLIVVGLSEDGGAMIVNYDLSKI